MVAIQDHPHSWETTTGSRRSIEEEEQKLVKNEKNQSCSKLPKMARKFVVNNFELFSPPPKKNKFAGHTNFLVKNGKNQSCSKLHELASIFLAPPQKKYGGLEKLRQKRNKLTLFQIGEKIGQN